MTSPRVVIVWGASSGIGRATAHRLSERGDHVVLVARSQGPLLEAEAECVEAGAASTLVASVDVRDAEAVEALVARVMHLHGRLDAVIHSAGVVAYGRLIDVPAEVFEGVVRTNILGPVNVARASLPHLRAQNAGSLVLIGSVIGNIAVPQMSSYTVTKWAMRSLARELQLENRDRPGVHVSCVSPGGVDTPIYLQAGNYSGYVGRPPPPVVSPDKVARVVLRVLEHPRNRVDVGIANKFMRFGFSFFPHLFDALVGPLFAIAAKDVSQTPASAGNVLEPQPELNRLHGDQGSSTVAIGKKLAAQLVRPLRR